LGDADGIMCENGAKARIQELIDLIIKDIEENAVSPSTDVYRQELEALEKKEKYFFYALHRDIAFGESAEFQSFERCAPEAALYSKRTFVVFFILERFLAWLSVADVNTVSVVDGKKKSKYTLDEYALTEIIKSYVEDLVITKKRYELERMQLPKVAGLMTNLIVKYRPIVPLNYKDNPRPNINEVFAIYHALCICSDFSDGDELVKFQLDKRKEHDEFYKDMRYLLVRNFTPENLMVVFKTLCMFQFPRTLGKS
jgi:hypothetical protein